MLLNCGVGEDSWESLGLQGDPTRQSSRRSVLNIQWKDWCWSWNSSTLAFWCEELTHWKRLWLWEKLKAGGEGDERGWYGCMASLTQGTWVWASSRSWWWTGKPAVHKVAKSHTQLSDWTELHAKKFADSMLNVRVNIHITIEVWKYLPHKHPFSESYWRMSSAKWGSKHIGGLQRGVPETVHSTSMHCTSSPCKALC